MKKKKLIIIVLLVVILIALGVGIFFYLRSKSFRNYKFSDKVSYKERVFSSKYELPIALKKVTDGYIIILKINSKEIKDTSDYTSDIRIAKYDSNFKQKWKYDYICSKELKKVVNTKNKRYYQYLNDFTEKDNKYYFTFSIYDLEVEDYPYTVLLSFDKNGSLYINKTLKDKDFNKIVDVSNKTISLSEENKYYEYNINTKKIIVKKPETIDESNINIIAKENNLYYGYSFINYYEYEGKDITEGKNSLYLFDDNFKVIKKINLDEYIGVKIDEKYGVNYDIKKYGDNFYISYDTPMATEEEEVNYYGLLIINKDLKYIYNIKYDDPKITKKIVSILDCYTYNNELYVILELDDDYVMIEKFDNYYNRIYSEKIKLPEFTKYKDSYSIVNEELLSKNKNIKFYQIIDDDNQNFKKIKSYIRMYSIK